MKEIANFSTEQEAAIARGMLESRGIRCEIAGQSALSSIFPTPDGSNFGGFGLYVNENQAAQAIELLREHGDI